MKKRILALILGVLMCLSLCACDDDESKELLKDTSDLMGKYGSYIDDHKDEIIDGLNKLEGIAQEAMNNATKNAD